MPDRYSVATRSVLGKRSKRLRWDGVLPANVYGRGLDSVAVQLPRRDAEALLDEHGLNALIELAVEGEGEQRPVVVRAVQRHPLTRELQHLDFYQVDLTRPIQAMVQVTLVGESPAVHTYQGIRHHWARPRLRASAAGRDAGAIGAVDRQPRGAGRAADGRGPGGASGRRGADRSPRSCWCASRGLA